MTEHPAESAYPRSQAAQLPPSMSAEILGSMKDGVIAVGRDGHILLMNPVAEQLFGIPAAMAVGQSFGEIFLIEEGLDEFNDHMLSAIYNPGVAQTIDLTLTTAGVQKHLVVRTSRLPAEHFREVEGMVAVIADDSERVLRLRERVELERVRAAAGRFIIAVMTIFSVFTLSLEPMQKLAINSGLDLGVYAALIAMMVAAFGIKWWTGIPAKSLGLTWRISGRDLRDCVLWSLAFCVFITAGKWMTLRLLLGIPPDERALFEFWVLDDGTPATSALLYLWGLFVYISTAPIQEISTRSALQAPLQTFLNGVVRHPLLIANVLTTLLFAVLHAHLDPIVAAMVIVPSLFWGWLFQRSGTVVSPTISHIIVGIYAVFVLGLFVGFDQR